MLDLAWAAAALAAFAGAIISSAALSTYATRVLRRMNVVQHVRVDGPESHLAKQGTVQMAGLGFVVAIVTLAGISGLLASAAVLRIVLLMCAFAAIGFVDDTLKGTVFVKNTTGRHDVAGAAIEAHMPIQHVALVRRDVMAIRASNPPADLLGDRWAVSGKPVTLCSVAAGAAHLLLEVDISLDLGPSLVTPEGYVVTA